MQPDKKTKKITYVGFPDLEPAMVHIRARKNDQPQEKQELLDKWIKQLESIDSEMRKLEKIEKFTQAICHKNR